MRLLLGSLFALAVAAVVGLGATYLALTRGAAFGALDDRQLDGLAENRHRRRRPLCAGIDRAHRPIADRARRRRLVYRRRPTTMARLLDGRCDVVLAGVTPAARFWTLTLYNADGELVANSINRYGFTSQEIVRHADGSFEIVVAPRANPGNWLPTGGVERYVLVLRLYDTAVGVSTKAGREVPMPAVNTRSCP